MSTPNPSPGMAPAPVGSTEWNQQTLEANARYLQAQQQYKATDPKQLGSAFDFITKPAEWAGSKLHQAYTYAVARPLATALIATQIGAAEAQSNSQAWSNLFNGNIWDRAYADAAHVSPGQALEFGLENFYKSNEDLKKALQQQVEYKVKGPTGQPTGQTVKLNQNGYLWDNPDAVATKFDTGIQKWISGGLDAGYSWYMDPVAKTGEGLGLLRDVAYVRPMVTNYQTTFADKAKQFLTLGVAGKVPTNVSNVQKNLDSSAFTQLGNLIEKKQGQLGLAVDDGTFENWVTQQPWAKNSADTPALANALGKAADRDQINSVLAIAMGDQTVYNKLSQQNAELGAQLEALDRQHQGLASNLPANPNPAQALLAQQRMQLISDDMSKIAAQRSSIQDQIALKGSMASGMYFNPLVSPIASNLKQYAQGLSTVKSGGITMPLALVYNNLYVRPLRVLTGVTWDGVRAPGHINVFEANSHTAFNASLDQAKAFSIQERQQLVSKYISMDPADRGAFLTGVDRLTIGRIAQKYGLDDDQANALFNTITGRRLMATDGNAYSAARITLPDGSSVRADSIDDGGGVIATHPILASQLENTHILTDYEHLDKVLKNSAPAFQKILRDQEIQARAAAGGPISQSVQQSLVSGAAQETADTSLRVKAYKAKEFTGDLGDLANKIWKFSALFRVGYGPRAITDDFMGQVARLGAYNTFMDRLAVGSKNSFFRNFALTFTDTTGYERQVASLESGISQKLGDIDSLNSRVSQYAGVKLGPTGRANLNDLNAKLQDAQDQLNQLRIQRNKLGAVRDKLGDRYVITPDGVAFPRPFEGTRGQMFRDLNSDRRTIDNTLGGTASDQWNSFRTSGDWNVIEPTTANEAQHIRAWNRVVSRQFANDPAAMIAVKGGTAKDIERFYNTADGNAYFNSLGLKMMGKDDLADRVHATVNDALPSNTPEGMAVRQAVIDGKDEKTVADLMKEVPITHRPSIQAEGVGYAMGKSDVVKQMDSIMSKWYDTMSRIPTEVLSRNPLFFSLYRQHVNDLWLAAKDQGMMKLTPNHQADIVEQARKLALKDVKRFTYNIDFESKVAHTMRFIAPFWGPMQEGFNRWSRLIADKPDIVAHAATLFTAPIRGGHAIDKNGNPVDANGYAVDPSTGEKYLVPKGDMHLQFQLPGWAAKGLGQEGFPIVDMPINTLNIVLQNDPWFNPGMGPWVQVPADYVAMNSNPKIGDVMQKLGILNRVTPNAIDQAGVGGIGNFLKTALEGPSPDQQQQTMLQIMQAEDYRYKTGLRADAPTWQEVKDRAAHQGMLTSLFKAGIPTPFSFSLKDPYQFFRDQYQQLQQANPKTADQIFLQKYGSAAYDFTGALTKSNKSLPATAEAVMADQRFKNITDQYPELAGLIIGPYGKGDFSSTAYQQQLASGDRVKLTAQQSIANANANLGWAQYQKYMNIITSGLYQAGFTSFQDKGATVYDNQRKALIALLGEPTLPGGAKNPFYNADWSQQFNTIDRTKQDRMAAALQQIATTQELLDDPTRADIRGLNQYMIFRDTLNNILAARKAAGGTSDINSKKNADLKQSFAYSVQGLVQSNTMFQSLHDRWLTNDMFNHYDPALGITEV